MLGLRDKNTRVGMEHLFGRRYKLKGQSSLEVTIVGYDKYNMGSMLVGEIPNMSGTQDMNEEYTVYAEGYVIPHGCSLMYVNEDSMDVE